MRNMASLGGQCYDRVELVYGIIDGKVTLLERTFETTISASTATLKADTIDDVVGSESSDRRHSRLLGEYT